MLIGFNYPRNFLGRSFRRNMLSISNPGDELICPELEIIQVSFSRNAHRLTKHASRKSYFQNYLLIRALSFRLVSPSAKCAGGRFNIIKRMPNLLRHCFRFYFECHNCV